MEMFSDPSKDVMSKMALGVAVVGMQIKFLENIEGGHAHNEFREMMEADGVPTSLSEWVNASACAIHETQMGWRKKQQFLGMIQEALISVGMPERDAIYMKGLIELSVDYSHVYRKQIDTLERMKA